MATLRLFASARIAAGVSRVTIEAATVGELLTTAQTMFGKEFTVVLANSKVWCTGEPTHESWPISVNDEVAVLPPVSGG